MDINNQIAYWNSVAEQKTFTHPLNVELLEKYLDRSCKIVDYGCGYGRIVKQLTELHYKEVSGFDTSEALIQRGKGGGVQNIFHLNDADDLPLENYSVDCFLLFAVLTCIPSNKAQQKLIDKLYLKLKPGGIIYLSDYYIQEDLSEVKTYHYLNGDKTNFGVFTLPEGATFRHHSREWIMEVTKGFETRHCGLISVKTMNGNSAEAFQLVVQKPIIK